MKIRKNMVILLILFNLCCVLLISIISNNNKQNNYSKNLNKMRNGFLAYGTATESTRESYFISIDKNYFDSNDNDLQDELSDLTTDERIIFEMINEYRKNNGLEPLKIDKNLMESARTKSKDMVENNYFEHYSQKYGTPFELMKMFNVVYIKAAENIAGSPSSEGAVNGWLNSKGHRENILNPEFNYTGIGVADGGAYGKMHTQHFIRN